MIRIILFIILTVLLSCSERKSINNELNTISSLSKELLANPNDTSLLSERLKLFLAEDNFSKAIVDQQLLFMLDSSNLKYRYRLAELYFNLSEDNPSFILNSFDLLSENLMVYPAALLLRGKLNYVFQKYEMSLKDINTYLPSNPFNADAYFYKGLNFKEMGDLSMAKSQFQTTVEQDPSYLEAYEQLAFIAALEGDSLAEFYFDNALAVDSSIHSSWYNKGMYHQNNESFFKAKRAYNGLLRQDSLNVDGHFNLGYIALLEDEFDVAIFHFGTVVQQNPNYASAYFSRGLAHKFNKNLDKAKEDFTLALDLNPQFIEAQRELNKIQ